MFNLPPLGDYTGGSSMYHERLNQVLPRAKAAGMKVNLAAAPTPRGSSVAPNLHQPISALGGLHGGISRATGQNNSAAFGMWGGQPAPAWLDGAAVQGLKALKGAY